MAILVASSAATIGATWVTRKLKALSHIGGLVSQGDLSQDVDVQAGDEVNQRITDRVNESGKLFLTHTKIDSQMTLRMSIGQTHTEARHVRAAWEAITSSA